MLKFIKYFIFNPTWNFIFSILNWMFIIVTYEIVLNIAFYLIVDKILYFNLNQIVIEFYFYYYPYFIIIQYFHRKNFKCFKRY